MFNKKSILAYIVVMMFSLFGKVEAKYEKLFFELNIKSNSGKDIDLVKYKKKTILLVNVASKCGFTKQYSGLQMLYDRYKDKGLVVIGVPSNQFGSQEPGTNSEIKDFCETNFNITFPITDKIIVKGDNTHQIYKWAKKNFGKSAVPKWNFHKILINKDGKIHDTYASYVNPMSEKLVKQIESLLD